jgi:hypothetical protein
MFFIQTFDENIKETIYNSNSYESKFTQVVEDKSSDNSA